MGVKIECVKVFKNALSKICGRQPLKNLKFLKGFPPQALLGPILNILTQIICGHVETSEINDERVKCHGS